VITPSCFIGFSCHLKLDIFPRDPRDAIAGVAYPSRRSQPDMYTIFTWVDQTRVPPDASVVAELKAPPVPRRKIENRWVSISLVV
jgi:hypothetical protein